MTKHNHTTRDINIFYYNLTAGKALYKEPKMNSVYDYAKAINYSEYKKLQKENELLLQQNRLLDAENDKLTLQLADRSEKYGIAIDKGVMQLTARIKELEAANDNCISKLLHDSRMKEALDLLYTAYMNNDFHVYVRIEKLLKDEGRI